MKKILFAVILVAIFSFAAMAQDAKVPALVNPHHADASYHTRSEGTWGVPQVPGTILFYGGDYSGDADPNSAGFADGNTLLANNVTTYGSVKVPKTGHIVAKGIFFNVAPTQSGTVFDPATGTYDIGTNPVDGVGYHHVTGGSGPQTATLTGRAQFGLPEYTTSVQFVHPLTAKNGTTYVVNESPQCTNGNNGNCGALQYFFSNTTTQANSVNGSAQVAGQMYLSFPYFGLVWTNWCDSVLGLPAGACQRASFGLTK